MGLINSLTNLSTLKIFSFTSEIALIILKIPYAKVGHSWLLMTTQLLTNRVLVHSLHLMSGTMESRPSAISRASISNRGRLESLAKLHLRVESVLVGRNGSPVHS